MTQCELPSWFIYPGEFKRLIQLGIVDLAAWHMLDRPAAIKLMAGLATRFPNRSVVPFACKADTDDVACWDKSMPGKVVLIHDWASPGYEQRDVYEDFWSWFRDAIRDMIEWIILEEEAGICSDDAVVRC
jgi:hypothetical protein